MVQMWPSLMLHPFAQRVLIFSQLIPVPEHHTRAALASILHSCLGKHSTISLPPTLLPSGKHRRDKGLGPMLNVVFRVEFPWMLPFPSRVEDGVEAVC